MNKWKRLVLLTAVLVVGSFTASLIWAAGTTSQAESTVDKYLRSSGEVIVSELGEWLTFKPADAAPTVGFIFYPGGNVDYKAYAPTLFELASRGYLVVDVQMPLDLAVMGVDRAADVIAAHPEIEHWVIGGHSLGGSMAARFIHGHPGAVEGLVLWASYPADSDSLADVEVQVVSISAALDGLATPAEIEASAPLLPADTVWLVIEGGNHAQFGYYGEQKGDNPAEISREEQQAQVLQAMEGFLAGFGE